jgi:hypothetical protein
MLRDKSTAWIFIEVPPPDCPPPDEVTPPPPPPDELPPELVEVLTLTLSMTPWATSTNSSTVASQDTWISRLSTVGAVIAVEVRVRVTRVRTLRVTVSPVRNLGIGPLRVARSQLAPLLMLVSTVTVDPVGAVAVQRTTDPVTGVPGKTNGSEIRKP